MNITLISVQILTLVALVWYAWETRKHRIAEEAFHKRERAIDVHFRIERLEDPTETDKIRYATSSYLPKQCDAMATVANLGRLALLINGISVRRRGKQDPNRQYKVLSLPVPQGGLQQFIVADLLVRFLHETGEISGDKPPDRCTWAGELEIALDFYCRRRARQLPWHSYAVHVSHDSVQSIHRIQED